MAEDIYRTDIYARFYQDLKKSLNGPNIKRMELRDLKKPAFRTGVKTKYGSYGWRSAVSSRIGPKTVYLGSEDIRAQKLSTEKKDIIQNAPEQLEKVLRLIKTLPFVHLKRQMGNNPEYNPTCNLYVSVADPKNHRLAYMWGNTMHKPSQRPGPEFTMIHIPEEHSHRQQVLALPEYHLNIALGTDYMGEDKKGFLRQAMWYADEHEMLGLHAGTKIVIARDVRDGKLKKYGVFMFGLTATGKSTWSCHPMGLDFANGEDTKVTQDDIVFLKRDGSALGSENGFFVKTDVEEDVQEAMYKALIHKSALYENVMVDYRRIPDFVDEDLCANGRAVIQRDQLKIKLGRRNRYIYDESINLPSLEALDGLVFAFITRRGTIMPFAQELSPEQAVLAYLWGESTHSAATQPAKAGESVRQVGTDPFIVGSRGRKVNRFYNIIMELVDKYPGKVKFFQYNTGGVGEIIETVKEGDRKRKNTIRKTLRVPIEVMAAIQRGDLRGTNRYELGRLGTKEIIACDGGDLTPFRVDKFYSEAEYNNYLHEIVEGRRQFTEEIAEEGLRQEIIAAAERSFRIVPDKKPRVFVRSPIQTEQDINNFFKQPAESWQPKHRPEKPKGWRH